MKTGSRAKRRRDLTLIVYVFFIVAVIAFFLDTTKEGKLIISSRPSGAHVYLDKKDFGKTPVEVPLKKGEYDLEVISDGFTPFVQKIIIEAQKTKTLDLQLLQAEKDSQKAIDNAGSKK